MDEIPPPVEKATGSQPSGRIRFNRLDYPSREEMPEDVRALYDAALLKLRDSEAGGGSKRPGGSARINARTILLGALLAAALILVIFLLKHL